MPLISIIVPVFNVEPYLRRCVDSILAQTFTDLELILVDDGSTDRCPAICDEYAKIDKRVQVIHKCNGGVSTARNAGLKCVTGEFLTFCDSDDWYASEWLSTLLSAMQTHNVDMVVGDFFHVCDNDPQKREFCHKSGFYETATLDEKISYIYNQLFGGQHGWEIWSRLFRSSIIAENGIKFCETCGNFAEDLGFVLEYILHSKNIVSIDYIGYYYFLRSDSMMRSSIGNGRLDAHNEISLNFSESCKRIYPPQLLKQFIPIVHFLIMFSGYSRTMGTEQYKLLHAELVKMKRYDEWKQHTKRIFTCRRELGNRFGRFNALRIILLSHYCLHGNWRRFSLESALFYKLNKP